MAKKKTEYSDINLVKTDYDNFKNLRFFIDQYKKATKMLEEVESFYDSFIKSKCLTIEQLIELNFPLFIVTISDGKYSYKYKFENRKRGLSDDDFGWNSEEYDEYCNIESEITKYLKTADTKKIPIDAVSEYLNQNYSQKILSIYGSSYITDKYIMTNNNTLLDIPEGAKSSFEITPNETELHVTFNYTKKYKKCRTPGWLPWSVDKHMWNVVFDTTTNNFLRYTKEFYTHEEQDRANRGY